MKLSAPIFQLKRRAKIIARERDVKLSQALDTIAQSEGFQSWSALSARMPENPLSQRLLSALEDGDLLLLGGRPGHGKTILGLQLLLQARRDGKSAVLFTLEFTREQALRHLKSLDGGRSDLADHVDIVTSDDISADYMIDHLSGAPQGTVAIVDYLQLLDQQRTKPPLIEQIETLRAFAKTKGIIFGFMSQIDRNFDPTRKQLPDINDIRLPNRLDVRLFTKACFLHDSKAQFHTVM